MIKVPKKQFKELEEGLKEMKKEIEEWRATLETLEDEEVMEQIERSKKAVKEGKVRSWKEVRKEL